MIGSLEATDELATQLSLVHSVLQLEGDLSFEDAVKVSARELGLSRGYIELLVEILVERGEFEFVQHVTEVGSNHFYRLQFVGARDLALDIFDLERINLAGVAKRLADRLTEMKAELKRAGAVDREAARLNNELVRTERMINSAREALERRKASLAVAEQKVVHYKGRVSEIELRITELVEQRDRQRQDRGLPPAPQDDSA